MFLGVNKRKKAFYNFHTGTCWYSYKRQILFKGPTLGNKCCVYNKVLLYLNLAY